MKNIGQKIIEFRKKIGMTAAELARRAGVTRGFISLVEKGQSGIGEEKLSILSNILGVELQAFRRVDDEMPAARPDWLKFLVDKFQPSVADERELMKLASKISLIQYLPGEPIKESKQRWKSFYEQMLPYLPSASSKVLLDSDVRKALMVLGVSGNCISWREVFNAFSELINHRFKNVDVETGAQWKTVVAQALHINEPVAPQSAVDKNVTMAIAAVQSQIQSSYRIYGAVVRNNDGSYMFMAQPRAFFNRRDFAWWHEAARILIDPYLTMGRGAYYFPDGEDMPPFAFFLRRLAAWLAYMPFKRIWLAESGCITPIKLQTFVKQVYGDIMPWRESFIALLDFKDVPLAYLDCYPRMKRGELKECGIAPENLKEMCSNERARLRIGYVFRNIVADEVGFELRNSLRVSETSPIAAAFKNGDKCTYSGADDLGNWDATYDLSGTVLEHCLNQVGINGERHVRVVMEIKN